VIIGEVFLDWRLDREKRNSARVPPYPERYPPDNVEPIPMTFSLLEIATSYLHLSTPLLQEKIVEKAKRFLPRASG
jgi:hypothetical protein